MRAQHEQNRRAWNEATPIHNAQKGDQVAFFRAGGSTLPAEEIAQLGGLYGKRLLHLQCNCGQDTLSLARLGASVTGVDISDTAIGFARELSAATEIPGEFVRSDVLDFDPAAFPPFDVVYASRGAICWISDLRAWMATTATALAPGGYLYLHDLHPTLWMLESDLSFRYSYFHVAEPFVETGLDYVGGTDAGKEPHCEWQWTLGDIVTYTAEAGLRVRALHEHPYAFYHHWPQMVPRHGHWWLPEGAVPMPLSFTLVAERPA